MPARFSMSWPQAASDKKTFISEELSAGPARMRGGITDIFAKPLWLDSSMRSVAFLLVDPQQ